MKTLFKQMLRGMLAAMLLTLATGAYAADGKVVVAYVTAGSKVMPDAHLMTHINYAFGHVSKTFDALEISNPSRLDEIVALKRQNKQLKVMLSVGGWGSGNFSEMAADKQLRGRFVKSCLEAVKRHRLDGIDIDWEYPTSSAAGISSSPQDTQNFTLLMRDLRKALGKKRLLTFASVASARYVDMEEVLKYVDFVNVMAYDMAVVPRHHAALFTTESGYMSSEKAMQAHLDAGVPADRLVLGMPFYGKGKMRPARGTSVQQFAADNNLIEKWNDEGKFPYLEDADGQVVYTFDNARSLQLKCRFANEHNLLGAMYWEYGCDDTQNTLARTVWQEIMEK
ncbi:MAG: glycoside hydrolase family 18 protein [Muribaculaceae bacterium]